MHCANDSFRILICGAASGLGLACAEVFAASGARLFLADCDGPALDRVSQRLGAPAFRCDSISEVSVASLAQDLACRFPVVDVLINAAGRGYVRSLAMVRMTQAVLPLMGGSSRRAFVVNVASVDGFTAAGGIFPYASSLAAWQRLSEALARQVDDSTVEVVSFTPRIARAQLGNRAPADQLYRLVRIDQHQSATRILRYVTECSRGREVRPRVA